MCFDYVGSRKDKIVHSVDVVEKVWIIFLWHVRVILKQLLRVTLGLFS